MAITDITISVEDLVKGDEIVAYTAWTFDHGTQAVTGSWIVGSVHWMAADRLADVYTNRGLLGFRRGDKVTVRRETAPEAQTETVEQEQTKGQQFAQTMRSNLGIGARTRRFRKNVDLHAEILDCIRNATYYPGYYTGERADLFQAAFQAQVSYTKHIAGYRADATVVAHINALTPYQFCTLLGDMVDADITNVGQGEQFFADMARGLHAQAA